MGDGHQITRQLLPIIASIAKRAEPGRLGAPVRVLEVEQIIADLCGLDDSGGSEGDWHLAGQFTGSLAGRVGDETRKGIRLTNTIGNAIIRLWLWLWLWYPWQNGGLQQIAAIRFSIPQDVIAILLQGFVSPILSAIPKILLATCAKGYGRTIP